MWGCMKKAKKTRQGFSAKKKEKIVKILSQLRKKMAEIDKLKKEIDYRHISFSMKPKQTKALIEEIKVPSLELIKDESARKK